MKFYLTLLFTLFLLFGKSQNSTEKYIEKYKNIAISEMQRTGIPASIILAQAIIESQSGLSDLSISSNNHFGIKCGRNWKGKSVRHDDDLPNECFRSYSTPEDSFVDHSDFLKSRSNYSFLFKIDPNDYVSWCKGLKKAGYATSKVYDKLLIKCIEKFNLHSYTLLGLICY